jgi:hypothetical protein
MRGSHSRLYFYVSASMDIFVDFIHLIIEIRQELSFCSIASVIVSFLLEMPTNLENTSNSSTFSIGMYVRKSKYAFTKHNNMTLLLFYLTVM